MPRAHKDLTSITYGEWSWKPDLLMSKIVQGELDECWGWIGATSPHANLFGAKKNGHPQMTQAARLIWQTVKQQPLGDLEVRHTCGNRYCSNWNHMATEFNHMRKTTVKQPAPQPPTRRAQLLRVDSIKELNKWL